LQRDKYAGDQCRPENGQEEWFDNIKKRKRYKDKKNYKAYVLKMNARFIVHNRKLTFNRKEFIPDYGSRTANVFLGSIIANDHKLQPLIMSIHK